MRTTAYALAVMMIVSSLTCATIINVPGDYPTIQGALAVAAQGDTVLVQPGTYVENILWPPVNDIKLLSAGDSSNTIIDGHDAHIVIAILVPVDIDTTTVISGFGITNGGGRYAHGICGEPTSPDNWISPTIRKCAITRNRGRGIWVYGGTPVIEDCAITENEGGGILLATNWTTPIRNSVITGNYAEEAGGGIMLYAGCVTIENCIISGNVTDLQGGGIWICFASNTSIERCLIIGNHAEGQGGGIYYLCESHLIKDCTISANSSGSGGGGIFCDFAAHPTLIRVLVEGNSASHFGGGICALFDSYLSIQHCTIVRNHADVEGDGVYVRGFSPSTISRSNIYSNGMGVYNLDATQELYCPNNWWGDATGPYNLVYNPLGLGDSTNATVNPIPFLTEPDSLAPPFSVPGQPVVQTVAFVLHQNYPNPFNPITKLSFDLPVPARVNLSVYDVLGRRVATLANGWYDTGNHQVLFNGSELASGIYFYELSAGNNHQVRKAILSK